MKWRALFVVLAGCMPGAWPAYSDIAVAQPPPRTAGVATDPAFDWENPPSPGSPRSQDHRPEWLQLVTFRSARTLEQTTGWARWALEHYGHVKEPAWTTDLSDVRFRGCAVEWTERRLGAGVTTLSRYGIDLRDVDLNMKAVYGYSTHVNVDLVREIEVTRRYFEGGREKGSGRDRVRYVQLPVRNEDHIGPRIAWALNHASRLCGARVKTEY
jgi:hypothetical protein